MKCKCGAAITRENGKITRDAYGCATSFTCKKCLVKNTKSLVKKELVRAYIQPKSAITSGIIVTAYKKLAVNGNIPFFKEVAKETGFSENTVRRYIVLSDLVCNKQGTGNSLRIMRSIRILEDAYVVYKTRHKKAPNMRELMKITGMTRATIVNRLRDCNFNLPLPVNQFKKMQTVCKRIKKIYESSTNTPYVSDLAVQLDVTPRTITRNLIQLGLPINKRFMKKGRSLEIVRTAYKLFYKTYKVKPHAKDLIEATQLGSSTVYNKVKIIEKELNDL